MSKLDIRMTIGVVILLQCLAFWLYDKGVHIGLILILVYILGYAIGLTGLCGPKE